MKQNKLFRVALLLIALLGGASFSWGAPGDATAIPTTAGTYIDWSNATITSATVENSGANIGSTGASTVAEFAISNSTQQDYILTFATGASGLTAEIDVTLTNSSNVNVLEKVADVENTGSWTPTTPHNYYISQLPVGTYTLRLATKSTTGSYAGNWGRLAFYTVSDFGQVPGTITLSKGIYNGPKESGGDVGYVQNNGTASYSFYNTQAGICTVSMNITKHNNGSVDLEITDEESGTVEAQATFAITESASPANIPLTGSLTTGVKSLKLTFHNESGYICNYSNMSLSIDPSNWKDIAIDLRNGKLGTDTSNPDNKYLTISNDVYTYSDDEPASYNAYLTSARFNSTGDPSHGYVNLKAKVPVESGSYKIMLGTCQYGTGTAYLMNADESVTKNVIDVNGQTVQSINQNTGACYHNNTTENVVSMWYTASEDETITIVCGNYTPYFAIEKVSSVPELKYVVTYAKDDGIEGVVPNADYATAGNSVTLPINRTLYKDGYTLTGWNDGTTTYAPGTSYTPTANVTMTAVFTQNTCTFDQTVSEMTVRWDFQRQNGCPTISMQGSGATAILVQQANVNGNTIDMKLAIDATSGKFANGSWNDWAQVNETTLFSFPSVEGTTVKAFSMNEPKNISDVKSSVDGNEYSSYASNIATYATTPANGSSTLTVKGDTYYRYIDVTYPAAAITGITELTVDGVAVGSDIILAINNGDAYTATLSGNTYTTVPAVQATFDTSAQATGVVSGTGSSRTYTITQNDKTYTLIIEGIHIYNKGEGEETINLKYTSDGNDKDHKIWTNGVYSISPVGDGWNNSGFKLKASEGPFTLAVPSDVQVKQFIIHEFVDNYQVGSFNTITSTGMTTAYIPTKHNFGHQNGAGEAPAKYDLIINLDGHQAGQPIVFNFTGGSQITGWYELTVAYSNPGTAPQKTGENVVVRNNHAAVSVTFDREIPNNVTATINGGNVTAEGGATTLVFPVWNLSYSTNYTLSIPANAVEDAYGNKNSEAIEIAVNVPAKPAVAQAAYDYVVGTADELKAAVASVKATNNSSSAARKTIFLKNGDYDLGSSSGTVMWVEAHNISFIGESRDGVVIHGTSDGISNPVLNLRDRQGYYLQDLTVRNDKNYGLVDKNGVAVAIYGGDKTVMKNVRMQSNQDTQVTGDRAYFEDCKIHGTVDFICGGGDNFYYHTDLILENRGGNVIAAPSTNSSTKWGYVFRECTIDGVDATAVATNAGSYYLGRPWQNEPRAYFLNTTMNVLPNNDGWTSMGNLPTHFYEYNSTNSNGTALDLSVRKNSPTSTNTYTPVLPAEEAAKYTLENVLGGTDSWLPSEECVTLAAPTGVSMSGKTLSWNAVEDARCYVILKDGVYYDNQTETSIDLTEAGSYTVRAANLNGGLGETSAALVYIIYNDSEAPTISEQTGATVTLTRTINNDRWVTIVLPFDVTSSDITASFGEGTKVAELTASSTADNLSFSTSLTGNKMSAHQPYAIRLATAVTEVTFNNVNITTGTPTQHTTYWDFVGTYTAGNIPVGSYFFSANMLYRATDGTDTIKPLRAYFKPNGSTSARQLSFTISDSTTGIETLNFEKGTWSDENVYDLQGRRVEKPTKGLYIVNGKKIVIK